ncbi:helix-turn-helix domain-containing protein [Clostridium culturomicium]|uniref:helix-turn-helix domain-containing protein n=1 Tax=Clostridium culturomicium TaxID=1499683 RepID=UPI000591221B|nr:helix-turn-helix domain-containing protein [Clostridium culturomicium]
MNRLDKIKDMEYKISDIKKQLKDLDDMYLKAFSPKGYKSGTSYNDYDTIPGGNKEFHIEEYFEEKKRLETLLDLDKQILLSLKREVDEKEYLELLNTNSQKVKFLRVVKGYTQAKTAEVIGVSERTVQRIENNI